MDHQLTRTRGGEYYVEKTKTENGVWFIYMTDEVKAALQSIIDHRRAPRKEPTVDGYTGFLLLDKDGKPKVAMHLEHPMKRLLDNTMPPMRSNCQGLPRMSCATLSVHVWRSGE